MPSDPAPSHPPQGSALAHPDRPRGGRLRVRAVTAVLVVLLLGAVCLSLSVGPSETIGLREGWRAVLAAVGLADPLPSAQVWIVELRWTRTLVTAMVGACLALAGGLLQGVFRNDLAAPSILGTTAGASLGASLAILAVGGHGLSIFATLGPPPVLVQGAAFVGAASVTWLVAVLGRVGGRISVPTLLLVGIAINAVVGGILAAMQSFALTDFEVARAMFAWGFGHLDDKGPAELTMVGIALLVGLAILPLVARELDLFEAGEEDAQALGVNTSRVKWLALLGATLCAAAAVAAVGQIAFVGLVVPHMLRQLAGRSYRTLLPLCLLGGAVFLLGVDASQRYWLGDNRLRPGVTLSLVGGPFFLFLLVQGRRRLTAW